LAAEFDNSAYFCRCSWQNYRKRHRAIGGEGIGFEGAKARFIANDGIRSKRTRKTVQNLLAAAKN
jgi:hypothetical protein